MSKYLLFVFLFFLSAPAFADCTSPAGVNSQTRYDFAQHKMFYCDGSNWVSIPRSGGLGCVLDGVVVNDGSSFNFYSAQNHANCTTVRQSRLCTNGVLGGGATYQYAACSTIDTTPDAFNFVDITGQPTSTQIGSNSITITGIDAPTPVSVSGQGAPLFININGAWMVSGNITNGQTLGVRMTSAASNNTTYTVTINVGGVTDSWSVTTAAAAPDTTPNAFSFSDLNNVVPLTYQASSVTITGIDAPTPVSVSGQGGAKININGTGWVTSGTITNGQTLHVSMTAAGMNSTTYTATINVGGVVDDWTVATRACSGGGMLAFGGYCWRLGADGQNCDTACGSYGGCNLEGITAFGSGGNDTTCRQLLQALGRNHSASSITNGGIGCSHQLSPLGNYRDTITTTCSALRGNVLRACACRT